MNKIAFYSTEYQRNIAEQSAKLKAQMPNFARIQADANEKKMKEQREKERLHRNTFEERASEIGYVNALVEDSTKVDTTIAEAEKAIEEAISYKK